jgi:cell division protein FtsB
MDGLKIPLNKKTLLFLVGFVLFAWLIMDLNSRLVALDRLTNQHKRMGTDVASLMATHNVLNTRVAYATSASAVEEWARESGSMAKPGDVVVIPIPEHPMTVVPTPVTELTPTPMNNLEVWEMLFFGN